MPTWSVLAPSSVVTRFQPAAWADGTATRQKEHGGEELHRPTLDAHASVEGDRRAGHERALI